MNFRRTVALVEDDDDFLLEHGVFRVTPDENRKFLNRRDDDFRGRILQLSFKNRRARIAVGCAPLEFVVFAHGLVVEVFAVDHEQHFVDVAQLARQLCCLERGQRLAAARL